MSATSSKVFALSQLRDTSPPKFSTAVAVPTTSSKAQPPAAPLSAMSATSATSFFRAHSSTPADNNNNANYSSKNMMDEIVGKKTSLYLATRLRGAILRECKNAYETKCTYEELSLALTALKIVPQDRKALKSLFTISSSQSETRSMSSNISGTTSNIQATGTVQIAHLLASLEFVGTHISGFTMIKFDSEKINSLINQQNIAFVEQLQKQQIQQTAENNHNNMQLLQQNYGNREMQSSQSSRFRKTRPANMAPLPHRSATASRMRPIISDQNDMESNGVNESASKNLRIPLKSYTPGSGGRTTPSREHALISALAYAKTSTNSDSAAAPLSLQSQLPNSTFKVNEQNPEEFKGIRLPRPKNLRNELNLRQIIDKDLFQVSMTTPLRDNQSANAANPTTAAAAGTQGNNTLRQSAIPNTLNPLICGGGGTTTNSFFLLSLIEKVKNKQVGYHHIQELERIFGELDPTNSGFADREKFMNNAKKHLGKTIDDELLNEIVGAISDSSQFNSPFIVASKLSGLLDVYKFDPRSTKTAGMKNNSENYRRKMLDDKDISVQKLSDVHELYVLLIEKLEEKFEKFQRAYYFFDPDPDGRVYYIQFKQTLDKLCLRVKDDEAKDLFAYLDKKQDGYLDYEELCALVPNRLELEMLERNGESLIDRTRQIYERFGDLQNFNADPHRQNERARYQTQRLVDETTNKIGREIFYSDKLRDAIASNVVMRFGRCEPGESLRRGYDIPSDVNTSHAYGLKPKHGENMYDIMSNNYAKEWTLDLQEKRKRNQLHLQQLKLKKRSKNTFANMMRQLHNSTCLGESKKQLSQSQVDSNYSLNNSFSNYQPNKHRNNSLHQSFTGNKLQDMMSSTSKIRSSSQFQQSALPPTSNHKAQLINETTPKAAGTNMIRVSTAGTGLSNATNKSRPSRYIQENNEILSESKNAHTYENNNIRSSSLRQETR